MKADKTREDRLGWVAKLGLLVGLVSFAILAVLTAQRRLPWQDEILTLYDSRRPLSSLLFSPFSHKGYILCVKAAASLFGESILVWRLPAILLGLVSLAGVHTLGKRLHSPLLGAVAAVLLAFHAEFLFFSTNARGYIGSAALAIWGLVFLWNVVEKGSWFSGLLAALCFYAGFRMHPTAALLYPGVFLFLVLATVQRLWGRGWRPNKKYLIGLAVLAMVGLALFLPRFLEYRRWNSLLVPKFIMGESTLVAETPSFWTLEGWSYHLAPFVVARGHEEWVGVGILVALAGALLPRRGKGLGPMMVLLSILSVLLFFLVFRPRFLPHRYLFSAMPLFALLMAMGVMNLCALLSRMIPDRYNRALWRKGMAWVGCLLLAWPCLWPLLAEARYGGYGDRWMVPVRNLMLDPGFADTTLLVVESSEFPKKKDDLLPFWTKMLATLRLQSTRVGQAVIEKPSDSVARFGGLKEREWVLARDLASVEAASSALKGRGYGVVRIAGAALFMPPSMFAKTEGAGDATRALEVLSSDCLSELEFHFSRAALAEERGWSPENEVWRGRALDAAGLLSRWDFPRTAGKWTATLASARLEAGQPRAAASWYALAFGEKESRLHDYIGYLGDIPVRIQDELCASGEFRSGPFLKGLLEKLESDESREDSYRAYWAFKGAQTVERCSGIGAAVALYDYSASKGDSLGRASQRLYDYYSRGGDIDRRAKAYYQAYRHGSGEVELYLSFFENNSQEEWRPFLRDSSFPAESFLEGLEQALAGAEGDSLSGMLTWGSRMAEAFKDAGIEEKSAELERMLTPLEGDRP